MLDQAKAEFFDTQVESKWASADYTSTESRIIEKILRSSGIGKGMNILEPGCGTGRLTEILARQVTCSGSVLAVDMSRRMVDRCAKRIAEFEHAKAEHGVIEEQNLAHNTYDFVICHNVFHHFKDKSKALSTFASTMKKGGKLLIFHFLNWSQINDKLRKIHPAVLHDTMPVFPDMQKLCQSLGMTVENFSNSSEGYVLMARNG
jgi:ubiquinone/menaquinone biosynthesis C-methylase UbiE